VYPEIIQTAHKVPVEFYGRTESKRVLHPAVGTALRGGKANFSDRILLQDRYRHKKSEEAGVGSSKTGIERCTPKRAGMGALLEGLKKELLPKEFRY
jgi:hypothetical protein